jgi:hypothetical protein
MTYTYVTMDVSHAAYAEIMDKLVAAGYEHAIHNTRSSDGVVLDMHGIALKEEVFIPKKRPNIAELEAILNSEEDTPITVNLDGSITA